MGIKPKEFIPAFAFVYICSILIFIVGAGSEDPLNRVMERRSNVLAAFFGFMGLRATQR